MPSLDPPNKSSQGVNLIRTSETSLTAPTQEVGPHGSKIIFCPIFTAPKRIDLFWSKTWLTTENRTVEPLLGTPRQLRSWPGVPKSELSLRFDFLQTKTYWLLLA